MTRTLLLAMLVSAAPAFAKPDFSTSAVIADPATPGEGDVVTFVVSLRNSGDRDAPGTEVVINLPLEGLFVDAPGLDRTQVDLDERRIRTLADLPIGVSKEIRFRVVVPRDSGGRVLSPDIVIRNLYLGAEYSGSATVDIDTRPGTGGVRIGSFRIAPAGLGALAVILLYPVLYLIVRQRVRWRQPGGEIRGVPLPRRVVSRLGVASTVLALVLPIGFWAFFATMAWTDWRSLNEWPEAACTILDTRLPVQTSASATSRSRSNERADYRSLLALRYRVGETEMISTGLDTGARVNIGGAPWTAEESAKWTRGATVPCWYDPSDPKRVVVWRGFGGAYFFALFPLPVFLAGLFRLRALM